MNQFIESVRAQATGIKKAVFTPLSVDVRVSPSAEFTTTEAYDFRLEWNVRAYCEKKDFKAMLENVVRQLQADVYGDLQARVIRLQRAVLEHDHDAAMMECRDLIVEVMGK